MFETRSSIDSLKAGLYIKLLNSIEKEFITELLKLPPKDPVLHKEWCDLVGRAVKNKVITWKQFFAMLQPDFAAVLKAKIIEKAQDQKNYDLLAFLKSFER